MVLRGLKITWVCIAILFISCSIILSFKFKNSTFLLFPKHFSFCFYVPANRWYSKKTLKTFHGTFDDAVSWTNTQSDWFMQQCASMKYRYVVWVICHSLGLFTPDHSGHTRPLWSHQTTLVTPDHSGHTRPLGSHQTTRVTPDHSGHTRPLGSHQTTRVTPDHSGHTRPLGSHQTTRVTPDHSGHTRPLGSHQTTLVTPDHSGHSRPLGSHQTTRVTPDHSGHTRPLGSPDSPSPLTAVMTGCWQITFHRYIQTIQIHT